MDNTTVDKIAETIQMLSKKVFEETGKKIIIGFAIEDGEDIIEGAVKSGEISYPLACRMVMGINYSVSNHYANDCEDNPWLV